MLKCLIAFILGWLASKMMGNGFCVGGQHHRLYDTLKEEFPELPDTDFTITGYR